MLLEPEKYNGNYCLGQIHDFGSLVAKTQEFGMPIFCLTDEQIGYTGTVLENTKANIEKFREAFNHISVKIIERLND